MNFQNQIQEQLVCRLFYAYHATGTIRDYFQSNAPEPGEPPKSFNECKDESFYKQYKEYVGYLCECICEPIMEENNLKVFLKKFEMGGDFEKYEPSEETFIIVNGFMKQIFLLKNDLLVARDADEKTLVNHPRQEQIYQSLVHISRWYETAVHAMLVGVTDSKWPSISKENARSLGKKICVIIDRVYHSHIREPYSQGEDQTMEAKAFVDAYYKLLLNKVYEDTHTMAMYNHIELSV